MFKKKLETYVNLINETLKNILDDSCVLCSDFFSSLRYSVLNGGKRLRPVLTLSVCEMLGGNLKAAVMFACAVELIHSGSLVHDDLPCMDDSKFRRKQLSCHAKFGETVAVLAGDGLFLTAFKLLAFAQKFKLSPTKIVKACEFLSEMAGFNGMVKGQAIDMAVGFESFNEKTVNLLSELKTACLIRAACVMGALSSEISKETAIKIDCFAKNLGVAFQICDDLLDHDEKNFLESKNLKCDYVSVFGVDRARKKAEVYTKQALNEIKNFSNNEFLIDLSRHMLNRVY